MLQTSCIYLEMPGQLERGSWLNQVKHNYKQVEKSLDVSVQQPCKSRTSTRMQFVISSGNTVLHGCTIKKGKGTFEYMWPFKNVCLSTSKRLSSAHLQHLDCLKVLFIFLKSTFFFFSLFWVPSPPLPPIFNLQYMTRMLQSYLDSSSLHVRESCSVCILAHCIPT